MKVRKDKRLGRMCERKLGFDGGDFFKKRAMPRAGHGGGNV